MTRKFKPILFSTDMVQAILEKRKTQTRRLVTPQPVIDRRSGYVFDGHQRSAYKNDSLHPDWRFEFIKDWAKYRAGDVLWVRETFLRHPIPIEGFKYKADYTETQCELIKKTPLKWKPSIHMPKKAARIFLEVSSVGIERLFDISWEDCLAEGIRLASSSYYHYQKECYTIQSPRQSFESLWAKIHGIENLKSNPWVWAYSFKEIDKPDGFIKT